MDMPDVSVCHLEWLVLNKAIRAVVFLGDLFEHLFASAIHNGKGVDTRYAFGIG